MNHSKVCKESNRYKSVNAGNWKTLKSHYTMENFEVASGKTAGTLTSIDISAHSGVVVVVLFFFVCLFVCFVLFFVFLFFADQHDR